MSQTATRIARRSAADESRKWLQHYDREVPPHLNYPHVPLYCLLEETAARHPANPCTNFFGKRLTYQQINELSERFAASVHTLGARRGDRVVLLLPTSPHHPNTTASIEQRLRRKVSERRVCRGARRSRRAISLFRGLARAECHVRSGRNVD